MENGKRVYLLILCKTGEEWELFSAKEPITSKSLMKTQKLLSDQELEIAINKIIPKFELIEDKWKTIKTIDGPIHLVDIKFELGLKYRIILSFI